MVEHGAYSLLLDRYYATEEGIPQDKAHRLARARTKEEREAVDAVLAEFFTLADGVWTHSRVQEEIEKAKTKIEAARENGKKGGRPKKNQTETQPKPTGLSPGYVLETQAKAHQTPDTNHQESAKALSARGAVGIALKAGGIDPMTINLTDPRIDALIAAGATPDHWEGLAREAVTTQKSKPIAWVLAVLPERLKAAAGTPKASRHAGFASKDYRQGVDADGTFTA